MTQLSGAEWVSWKTLLALWSVPKEKTRTKEKGIVLLPLYCAASRNLMGCWILSSLPIVVLIFSRFSLYYCTGGALRVTFVLYCISWRCDKVGSLRKLGRNLKPWGRLKSDLDFLLQQIGVDVAALAFSLFLRKYFKA